MSSESLTHVVRLTPVGRGAIASVRVVGPRAVSLVDELLQLPHKRSLEDVPNDAICYGRWQSAADGEEVVVCRREHCRVEIHCHGGAAAVAAIVESLCARGCREIDWQQHLLSTSDDPVAAAAEIDLTQAPTQRTAMILWEQRNGALRRAIDEILALLHEGKAAEGGKRVDRLLAVAPVGLHLTEPWRVVLAGRPNVGKSSLVNALVGFERAIVHATPGTTRDLVSADCAIDGWPVYLTDTAGLREGVEPLESAGIELARGRLSEADLAVLVFDASSPQSVGDTQLAADWPAALHVFNKCDLLADDAALRDSSQGIRTSATARRRLGRACPRDRCEADSHLACAGRRRALSGGTSRRVARGRPFVAGGPSAGSRRRAGTPAFRRRGGLLAGGVGLDAAAKDRHTRPPNFPGLARHVPRGQRVAARSCKPAPPRMAHLWFRRNRAMRMDARWPFVKSGLLVRANRRASRGARAVRTGERRRVASHGQRSSGSRR